MFSLTSAYLCAKCHKPAYNPSDEVPIAGKIVVITGSNSGIGAVAALEMAKRGAVVIMACRDVKKGETVMDGIRSKVPDAKLELVELDLGDFGSVRKCAAEIKTKHDHINVLLNNAGVFFPDGTLHHTKGGLEAHMATNHLGHFLLTILLLDLLEAGAPSRIVFTSSSLALLAELDLDDLMLEKRGTFGYSGWGPYYNSKIANMYCVKELAKRIDGTETGIRMYALCPGLVKTEIFRHGSWFTRCTTNVRLAFVGLTPQQGVETILYCSLSKSCSEDSGKMYHFNTEWRDIMDTKLRDEIGEKLWEKSKALVGLKEEELPKSFKTKL